MNLYVYSVNSSHSKKKTIKYIESKLRRIYPDIISISYDNIDTIDLQDVRVLIFSGGDGIFNKIVNDCYYYDMQFGYIPTGTANDMGHNLGMKNINTAIDIIRSKRIKKIKLLECITDTKTRYFLYALSIGRMSNISNNAKKEKKRLFGKFIYILRGCLYLFSKKELIKFNFGGNEYKDNVKCLIVTRSKYLGGMKIQKEYNDGLKVFLIHNISDIIKMFIFNNLKSFRVEKFEGRFDTCVSIDGEPMYINHCIIKESKNEIKLFN